MNYIGKVLDILQDWDSEITKPIYSDRYMITIDTGSRTIRRMLIRTLNGLRDEFLDVMVGTGIDNSLSVCGLSHYTMKNSMSRNECNTWYQMRVPCDSFGTVKFISSKHFTDTIEFELDITSEENVFQQSTIADVDIETIQALSIEMSQFDQYISKSENLVVMCNGYKDIDFNQIFEALNV